MKLKKIVENMDKMPSTLKGFNNTPKLTPEQKSKLMEMVRNYNQLGQKLRMENSLIETATALSEISELAETYACNEASDWFATEVVKSDFKRARGISETFQKIARECHGKVQHLNALYEDMGQLLERYYEIQDPMAEVAPNPANIAGQRGLPNAQPTSIMQEVNPNDKNIKSQRQLPANGPLKEVAVDDKHANIKGQRDLPSGGPAPSQVKECVPTVNKPAGTPPTKFPLKTAGTPPQTPTTGEVREVNVDAKHANIKGQRELPHTNGPATPQIKETGGATIKMLPQQKCKICGKNVQRTLSAELCPDHANPKAVNVKEVAVDGMNANIKSQRDCPSGGPTAYNPPKDPKDTGSVKEVTTNDANLQSQRELPQGGPESYTAPKLENPSVPVNPAGAGECNVKGERDVPQGGPATDPVYKGQNESLSLKEMLKKMKR